MTTTNKHGAPARSSDGARAIRCAITKRRCSARCCRSSSSMFRGRRPPTCVRCSTDVDDVRVESGFGGGEHLIAEASLHPRTGFIGIEPFVNGMAKALAAIDEKKLGNIRLHHGDATDVLPWLPAASVARVDLLYPDPWPKRRHWKRRFVQDGSVAAIARAVRPGGEFRFASDIADYVCWTLVAADARARFHLDRGAGRRLAEALGGLVRHALRGQGEARGANADVFDFQAKVEAAGAKPCRLPAGAPARTAPRAARSTATASRSWRRRPRAPAPRCPWHSAATG